MSGNFWVVRDALKDAIAKRCAELALQRVQLDEFKKAHSLLVEGETPKELADILQKQILEQERKVEWIETQIRDLERSLERYSLAPAV